MTFKLTSDDETARRERHPYQSRHAGGTWHGISETQASDLLRRGGFYSHGLDAPGAVKVIMVGTMRIELRRTPTAAEEEAARRQVALF